MEPSGGEAAGARGVVFRMSVLGVIEEVSRFFAKQWKVSNLSLHFIYISSSGRCQPVVLWAESAGMVQCSS